MSARETKTGRAVTERLVKDKGRTWRGLGKEERWYLNGVVSGLLRVYQCHLNKMLST